MTNSVIELFLRLGAETRITARFENLLPGTFEKTSDVTAQYNCIAHVAYDCNLNWWPIPGGPADKDRYWPEQTPASRTMAAFVEAFGTMAYEPCDDDTLEVGYEKIAFFVSNEPSIEEPLNVPTHASRQLPCGKWTSKLGGDIDIVHDSPERLTGKTYGEIAMYLKRKSGMPIIKQVNAED